MGQVCRHAKYNYTCVIHGWDPVCTASASWISHMGVDKLPLKDKQPFYNVLVADGSQRYAAQENLVTIILLIFLSFGSYLNLQIFRFPWTVLAQCLTQKLVVTSIVSTPQWATYLMLSWHWNIQMRTS